MNRRSLLFLLLSLFAPLIFLSCRLLGFVPLGFTRFTYRLDSSSSRVFSSRQDENAAPNVLVYLDLSQEDPEIERVPIEYNESGGGNIDVPKGGIYLIGAVYDPAEGKSAMLRDRSPGKRDISSAVSLIGNFGVVQGGLDTLPVSEEAESQIDLGELSLDSGEYGSKISLEEFAQGSGYSTELLLSLGGYDNTILKFLNPDIDRNGTFDADENLMWKFYVVPVFRITQNDYDYESGSVESQFSFASSYNELHYNFKISKVFGYPDGSTEPDAYRDIQLSCDAGFTITAHWLNIVENLFIANQSATDVYFMPDAAEEHPVNGSYTISFGDEGAYYIDSVEFFRPEDNYNNFVFPICRVYRNSSGRITSAEWKWLIKQDGSYRDAAPEEVEIFIKHMLFSWELEDDPGNAIIANPEDFGLNYYEAGSLDLSGSEYDNLTLTATNQFFIDFVDIGDNYYKFNFDGEYAVLE